MHRRYLTTIINHVSDLRNIVLVALFCLLPGLLAGQTTVTFRLDLSRETANRFFRPDSDTVELLGDIAPLSMKKGLLLQQSAHSEGLYSVTVEFPQITSGKILTFQFALRLNGYLQPENDDPARRISLHPGKRLLPVAHFQMHFQVFESDLIFPQFIPPVRNLNPLNGLYSRIYNVSELTKSQLVSSK